MPPIRAAYFLEPFWTELLHECVRRFAQGILGDRDIFDFDPLGVRNPLSCESLEVFHGVLGGEVQECSDQVEAFIVREVCCRALGERFPIEILKRNTAEVRLR